MESVQVLHEKLILIRYKKLRSDILLQESDLLINGKLTGFNEALTLEFVINYVIRLTNIFDRIKHV